MVWYPFNFFKACLPQILLGPFLNTLTHTMLIVANSSKSSWASTSKQMKSDIYATMVYWSCDSRGHVIQGVLVIANFEAIEMSTTCYFITFALTSGS